MTTAALAPVPTADFGTRFSAFVIDGFLLFGAQWVMFIVLSRQLQAVGMTSTEPCVAGGVALCEGPSAALWALLLLVLVGSTIGYHAVFEGRFGATPGKRWMGLAVTDQDGAGPIGMTAGAARSVVRQSFWLSLLFLFDASPLSLGLPAALFVLLPIVTLSVFVIGAFNQNGLAGHDIIAQTMVVRTDQVTVRPVTGRQASEPAAPVQKPVAHVPPPPSGANDATPNDSEDTA